MNRLSQTLNFTIASSQAERSNTTTSSSQVPHPSDDMDSTSLERTPQVHTASDDFNRRQKQQDVDSATESDSDNSGTPLAVVTRSNTQHRLGSLSQQIKANELNNDSATESDSDPEYEAFIASLRTNQAQTRKIAVSTGTDDSATESDSDPGYEAFVASLAAPRRNSSRSKEGDMDMQLSE